MNFYNCSFNSLFNIFTLNELNYLFTIKISQNTKTLKIFNIDKHSYMVSLEMGIVFANKQTFLNEQSFFCEKWCGDLDHSFLINTVPTYFLSISLSLYNYWDLKIGKTTFYNFFLFIQSPPNPFQSPPNPSSLPLTLLATTHLCDSLSPSLIPADPASCCYGGEFKT